MSVATRIDKKGADPWKLCQLHPKILPITSIFISIPRLYANFMSKGLNTFFFVGNFPKLVNPPSQPDKFRNFSDCHHYYLTMIKLCY